MIIKRYLIREVLSTLMVVTLILMLLFMSNQFVRYLHWAAIGKYASNIIMSLMVAQVPLLLGLLLPLGLYLGILLSFGRLYVDSEMVVLAACGLTQRRLLGVVMQLALGVAILVAIFMLWLNPTILAYKESLLLNGSGQSLLQTIFPGRFEASDDGRTVYYVERLSRNRQKAYGIFMAKLPAKHTPSISDDYWRLLSANMAKEEVDEKTDEDFLVMHDGYRYFGQPGQKDFRIIRFEKYGFRLLENTEKYVREIDALPTLALIKLSQHSREAQAELHWRLGLPISALLLAFLAVPLAQVNPRSGRYIRLLPATLIYVLYANLMFVGRAWLEQGTLAPIWGLWWIHLMLLVIAFSLWIVKFGWRGQ